MNILEHINDFAEGTLNPDLEVNLFNELSKNEELRQELKHHILINNTTKFDKKAFMPAADTTLSLFSKMGFSTLSNESPTFWQKYKQGIISSLVSASLVAFLFLLFMNPYSNSNFNNTNNITLTKKVEIPNFPISANKEIIKSNQNSFQPKFENSSTNQIKYVYNTMYIYDSTIIEKNVLLYNELKILKNKLSLAINNSEKTSYNYDKQNEIIKLQDELYKLHNNSLANKKVDNVNLRTQVPDLNSNFDNSPKVNLLKQESDMGLILELGMSKDYYTTQENIKPKDIQLLNKSRISLMYKLSNELALGYEMRRENFYLVYNHISNDNQFYIYEQQPNFVSHSIILKYSPNILKFYNINPYISLVGGGNSAGELGRIILGLDCSIYNNNYLYINTDYNFLNYTHESIKYTTSKYGLQLGLGVKF